MVKQNYIHLYVFDKVYTLNTEIVARQKCRCSREIFFMSVIISSKYKFCFYGYSQGKVNSVHEFVKMKSWLLLTFQICLHNHLKFYNSKIPGIRRTPGSRENLLLLWDPRTHRISGT